MGCKNRHVTFLGLWEATLKNLSSDGSLYETLNQASSVIHMLREQRSKRFGFLISFDSDDRFVGQGLAIDVYEPYESQLFLEHIETDTIVFDIGANIGYYTLLASLKSVSGRIIALEPNLKNFLLLERNIIRNNITNATPLNLAAGSQTCEEKLYLSNDNQGDHRLYRGEGGRVCEIVNCTTIDALVESQNSIPNIIKIDTQGFDYYVLLGMQHLLHQNNHLTIFTEFWDYGNRLSGVRSEDYYRLLATHFKTVEFIDEEKQRTYPVDVDFVLNECQKGDWGMHVNLLCSK